MYEVADLFMEFTALREFMIGLEFVVGGFFVFYIVKFFYGTIERKMNREPFKMQLSWAFFFLGQFVLNGMKIFADFYQDSIPALVDRTYMNNVAVASGIIGLIAINFMIERILDSGHINSMILAFISVCVIFFFNFPADYLNIFTFIAYGSTLGIIYAVVFSRVSGHPRLTFMLKVFIVGFVLLFTGNFFKSDVMLKLLSEPFEVLTGDVYNVLSIRLIGDSIVISSIFVLQLSFEEFPSMMELNWREHLIEIHVLSRNGIEIFSKEYNDERSKSGADPDLMAAAITGVSDIVKELTGSQENLNLIDQGDQKILFEKNDYCIIILLTDVPLSIYKQKLKNLMEEITDIYGDMLKNWIGNIEMFSGIEDLLVKHFNVEGRAARKDAIAKLEGEEQRPTLKQRIRKVFRSK